MSPSHTYHIPPIRALYRLQYCSGKDQVNGIVSKKKGLRRTEVAREPFHGEPQGPRGPLMPENLLEAWDISQGLQNSYKLGSQLASIHSTPTQTISLD